MGNWQWEVTSYRIPVTGAQINSCLIIGGHIALKSWKLVTGNW